MNKATIKSALHLGIVKITFTKKDGTERIMNCTLSTDFGATHYEKKTERVKEPKDDMFSVWDVDKGAWRTLTISAITDIVYPS